MSLISVPVDLVEAVATFSLPKRADDRLQALMDRNTNGELRPEERDELEALTEVSESVALLRARALLSLGRGPR